VKFTTIACVAENSMPMKHIGRRIGSRQASCSGSNISASVGRRALAPLRSSS
jgi:hypothetical protein